MSDDRLRYIAVVFLISAVGMFLFTMFQLATYKGG